MAINPTPAPTGSAVTAVPAAPVPAPVAGQPTYAYIAKPATDRLEILTWEVHRILVGGTPTADSPYAHQYIKLAVEQVLVSMQGEIDRLNTERLYKDAIDREAFAKAQFFHDMEAIYKYGGTSDDHIVTLENWPVTTDANGYSYSLLPDSYVNIRRYQVLPGEEQVRAVEPMKRGDTFKRRYVPLANGQQHLVTGLQGNYGFYREGGKLYYYAPAGQAIPDKEVRIKFILRPSRFALPEPGLLQDAQDDMAIAKVVPMLMRKVAEDKVNDNNSTV